MTDRQKVWMSNALVGLAGGVVAADWVLPSSITLFFDELLMFGFLWLMKWVLTR